jgi:hypothetical protein
MFTPVFPTLGRMVPRLLPLCALLLTLPAQAQTPNDPSRLLEQLEKLAEQREQRRQSGLTQVLRLIEQAAASPNAAGQAYIDAYRQTELVGESAPAAAFAEWRDKNSSWVNSREFRTAAQLHLQYLHLTLRRGMSDDPSAFLQASKNHLQNLAEAQRSLFSRQDRPNQAQRQLLQNNLRESIFAKNWNLAPFFRQIPDWEWNPGNFAGIAEKNLRSYHRANQDPEILQVWDWQIQLEQDLATAGRRSGQDDEFLTLRFPSLRMDRAADTAAIGRPTEAVQEGLRILADNRYQEHPDYEKWVDMTRGWIKAMKPIPAPSDEEAMEDSTEPAEPAAPEAPAASTAN